jgi:multiple sugar transport system permease protein
MMVPTVAVLVIVIGYPVVQSVLLSRLKYNFLSSAPPKAIGALNYIHLSGDPIFWQALANTAIYTLGSVLIAMAVGALLALLTEDFIGRLRFVRALLLTPWAVPFIVVAFLFRYMFEERGGIINALLLNAHLVAAPVTWLNSAIRAMPTVMVANIWTQTPFFFLIFSAAVAGIPKEVVESARMDRAQGWTMIWHIKAPFMRGAALVAGLLMVISNFNDFAKIWAMTEGGPGYATTTLVVYVYRLAFTSFDFGYSSAVGVVWLLFLIVFAVLYIRVMQRSPR